MERTEIHRYNNSETLRSMLNPFEDVMCWLEGLTSVSHVEQLLLSKHRPQGQMSVQERSESVAKLVTLACKYLEQAEKGPKDISFLPLYYALLNLSKAYIVIGPYADELRANRFHGASYNVDKEAKTLEDDFITLRPKGAIPLFYRTLVGENILEGGNEQQASGLDLSMSDVYPFIVEVSSEYKMATGKEARLIPFQISVVEKEGKQRLEALCLGEHREKLDDTLLSTLQCFRQLHVDPLASGTFVSDWYEKGNTASLRACLRPSMLYTIMFANGTCIHLVPSSRGKLWVPEEFPLLCAFYHMSCVVRYDPDTMRRLMDSKYWPMLLALRKHGTYSFLLLFWSFVTQCSTYIVTG